MAKPTTRIARHTADAIHIREEQLDPAARYMWDLVSENVPYAGR